MKKFFMTGLLVSITSFLLAQDIDRIINAAEVERIERILSADDMQGRRTFTPGIDKAAAFIAEEFKKAGLKPVNGDSYFQEFKMIRTKVTSLTGDIDGTPLTTANVVAISSNRELNVNQSSGYERLKVGKGEQLYSIVTPLLTNKKNYFILVDTSQARMFSSWKRPRPQMFPIEANIILVLTNDEVTNYNVALKQDVTDLVLKNVVGTLPGKKKKAESVIFSGHYDHLGIGKATAERDSIFNGANDDAAGTTAVIMLAHYFGKKKDNERTLIFAAFTAEEVGGYGSQHFSRQFPPDNVMAMFNIEMIGTESKWGPNSAFITGYERSDMGKILEANLAGSKFTFYPDPYTKQNLFYRSDNATLARLGVTAHTISTSRMEADTTAMNKTVDKYYHTQDDEIETLDMKNMAEIIKAIAISSATIISGKDTPTRVDKTKVN